jgi:hypothetical protein
MSLVCCALSETPPLEWRAGDEGPLVRREGDADALLLGLPLLLFFPPKNMLRRFDFFSFFTNAVAAVVGAAVLAFVDAGGEKGL